MLEVVADVPAIGCVHASYDVSPPAPPPTHVPDTAKHPVVMLYPTLDVEVA